MTKTTYNIEGIGNVTLSDDDYLASGGEADIFIKDKLAIKIYHSPDQMIPVGKIQELRKISDRNVLAPKNIVFKGSSKPVGYSMEYKPNTHPLCKIFTKTFKDRNKISDDMVGVLISQMQSTINNIHSANCLCVDLNEMNEMISPKFAYVYFIDVDSYQTPNYHATAIMENIRDRLVTGNKWHEGSDWFSFAVLAFQMWIGIHPYKGKHPDYKSVEWVKRMDDGVSVFDPKVILPGVCNDLSVIPKSHLNWMRDVFENNARCAPPVMGDIISVPVPTAFKFIVANKSFDINLVENCDERIIDIFNFMGVNYVIGKSNIHKGKAKLPIDISAVNKVLMCESHGMGPVCCLLKDKELGFYTEAGKVIGTISATDMMARNGCIYTICDGKLIENSIISMGEKTIHTTRVSTSVMELTAKLYSGLVIQDLLGNKYLTIPYNKGVCANVSVKELNGYRVLDAKSERNVCIVIAEKKGKYDRFIFTFDASYSNYTLRITNDVAYADINMTVLPNGVTVLANDSEVEIFKDSNVKTVDNPPFNSTTKIYNESGVIHYVDGKDLYTVKLKN